MPALRSRTSTYGRNMAGRALWCATGMTDSDLGKPIVADSIARADRGRTRVQHHRDRLELSTPHLGRVRDLPRPGARPSSAWSASTSMAAASDANTAASCGTTSGRPEASRHNNARPTTRRESAHSGNSVSHLSHRNRRAACVDHRHLDGQRPQWALSMSCSRSRVGPAVHYAG